MLWAVSLAVLGLVTFWAEFGWFLLCGDGLAVRFTFGRRFGFVIQLPNLGLSGSFEG